MFTINTKFVDANSNTITYPTQQAVSLKDAMLKADKALEEQCYEHHIVNEDECFIYDALSDSQCYITLNNTCPVSDCTIVVSITNNNAASFVTQAAMLQTELLAFA